MNGMSSEGFTGVKVFNQKVSDVFVGTSVKESFLYITVTEGTTKLTTKTRSFEYNLFYLAGTGTLLSDETFFPYNFTMIDLPQAQITISNEQMDRNSSSTIKVHYVPYFVFVVTFLSTLISSSHYPQVLWLLTCIWTVVALMVISSN